MASSGPALTNPMRRPSRLNLPGQPASLATTAAASSGASRPSVSVEYSPPHHRIPLSVRIPGLFRTRVPLIAILPFFLLGYLFAPLHRFDESSQSSSSTSAASSSTSSNQAYRSNSNITALPAYEQGRSWTQKLLHPGSSRAPAAQVHVEPQEHFTVEDGLLYFPTAASEQHVNGVDAAYAAMPKQRHPILHLIEKAEEEWEDLLASQSTTLEQAVAEYKRRYKRPPPKGFDVW